MLQDNFSFTSDQPSVQRHPRVRSLSLCLIITLGGDLFPLLVNLQTHPFSARQQGPGSIQDLLNTLWVCSSTDRKLLKTQK